MDYESVMTFYSKDLIAFGDGYYWGDYLTVDGVWKDILGEDCLNTAGSAGPYRIEGNTIIETHDWSSYEIAIGATSTYEFRIVGDTLFVSGPVTSVFSDGEDWDDYIQMDEIRIRAK